MSLNTTVGEPVVSVYQEILGAISHGLHQTAQPLTVLHGTLELALLRANTVEECKQAIARSLDELRRVTACFEHVRSLVRQPQVPSMIECDPVISNEGKDVHV
jgi:hypothetical protein